MSVVTLMFLLIFNIMGVSISENLCPGIPFLPQEEKKIGNLWDIVTNLLIKAIWNYPL